MSEEATLDEFTDEGVTDQQDSDRHLPEIDEIPHDWNLVTVEDISTDLIGGGTPTKSNGEYWEGDIPWASVKDLNGIELSETEDYITTAGVENSATNIIPPNSVIISTRMTVGEPFLNQVPMAINQDMKAIIPDMKMIHPLFLVYSLWDKDLYLKSLGRGTTVDGITTKDLSLTHLELPSLEEQCKIATVLHNVDQVIEKTEKIIQQVRTVKRGVLQDLVKGRSSNTPLEKKRIGPRTTALPKDWEVIQIKVALDDKIIIKQQDGNHGSDYPRKDEFVDEGVPYISAEVLSDGKVDFSQAKYLTSERANQLRIGFAEDGDVLLAHNATVGPAGILEADREFVVIGTSLTYYRCNSDKLDNNYLTYFFQSDAFQKQLQDVMRQSTRNQVPITRQRNLHLILPPLEEQRTISEKIETLTERIEKETSYKQRLQRLKQALMQDLLSGKVRTTDTIIEIPDEIRRHG